MSRPEESAGANGFLVLVAYYVVAGFTNGKASFYLNVSAMEIEALKIFAMNSAIILSLTGLFSFSEEVDGNSFAYGVIFVSINGFIFSGILGLISFFVLFGIITLLDGFYGPTKNTMKA
jgi:hypothetical protein